MPLRSLLLRCRLAFCVVACALCVGGCQTIDARLGKADSPQALAQAVADYYVYDAEDESCAVAIISPTGSVFAQAGAATKHSLFRIASLSKFFLHPVLLKLHAQGRLNLDQPVTSCSKLDLPPEYGRITLRDLLRTVAGGNPPHGTDGAADARRHDVRAVRRPDEPPDARVCGAPSLADAAWPRRARPSAGRRPTGDRRPFLVRRRLRDALLVLLAGRRRAAEGARHQRLRGRGRLRAFAREGSLGRLARPVSRRHDLRRRVVRGL